VTTKSHSSIGIVCSDKFQKQEAIEIMNEVKLLADKKGIALPNDIIEKNI
jgi:2-dehydropantoate 2-reductase